MRTFALSLLAAVAIAQTNSTSTNTTTTAPAPAPPANQTFVNWWTGANATAPADMVTDSLNVATVAATTTAAAYTLDFSLSFSPSGKIGSVEAVWGISGTTAANFAANSRFAPLMQCKKTAQTSTATRLLQTTTNTAAAAVASTYDGWMGIWNVPAASTAAGKSESLAASWTWTGPVDNIASVPAWSTNLTASPAWLKNATFSTGMWNDSPNPAKRNFVKSATATGSNTFKYAVGSYMTADMFDSLDNYAMDFDSRLLWWSSTAANNAAAGWIQDAANKNYTVAAAFTTSINKAVAAQKTTVKTSAVALVDAAIAVCAVLALF